MEELPKLLASRRAHKAHLTKLRQKIDDTAEGTIADNEIALLKSLVKQLKQKRRTLKELNDKIAVLLETPEELEAEILDVEELDSLIVEKVYLTSLREFHKSSGINTESVKAGDVVLIHDDNHRRTGKILLRGLNIIRPNENCWSQMHIP